jgi:hypothetical protein
MVGAVYAYSMPSIFSTFSKFSLPLFSKFFFLNFPKVPQKSLPINKVLLGIFMAEPSDNSITITDDLFALIRKGDVTTLQEIKDSITSPLIQYSLRLISAGDLKRNEQVLKLLDLVLRHAPKPKEKVEDKAYTAFLSSMKDTVVAEE